MRRPPFQKYKIKDDLTENKPELNTGTVFFIEYFYSIPAV